MSDPPPPPKEVLDNVMAYRLCTANSLNRENGFTLVDAEVANKKSNLIVYAGLQEVKFEIPLIAICTISPVVADNLRRRAKIRGRDKEAWQYVEGDLENNDLDFLTDGKIVIMSPSVRLWHITPVTFRSFERWFNMYISQSATSTSLISADDTLMQELFYSEWLDPNCKCAKVAAQTPGSFLFSGLCARHDPSGALKLLRLASEWKISKLQYEIIEILLEKAGMEKFVAKYKKYPASVRIKRLVPTDDRSAVLTTNFAMTTEAGVKGTKELSGREYELKEMRQGILNEIEDDSTARRPTSSFGPFEVYWNPPDVGFVAGLASKLSSFTRMVMG